MSKKKNGNNIEPSHETAIEKNIFEHLLEGQYKTYAKDKENYVVIAHLKSSPVSLKVLNSLIVIGIDEGSVKIPIVHESKVNISQSTSKSFGKYIAISLNFSQIN